MLASGNGSTRNGQGAPAILDRIVLTQSRHSVGGRAYLARKLSEVKTLREARRSLKRYVVRAEWQAWDCQHTSGARLGGQTVPSEAIMGSGDTRAAALSPIRYRAPHWLLDTGREPMGGLSGASGGSLCFRLAWRAPRRIRRSP